MNTEKDLPAGFAILIIFMCGLFILGFAAGRYTAEKDIKARYHLK